MGTKPAGGRKKEEKSDRAPTRALIFVRTEKSTESKAMITNDKTTTYQKGRCAFFMRSRDQYGKLSNMTFGFPLKVNGMRFQGPEGLYQALKFPHDPQHQALIAQQRSGMEAKRTAYQNSDVRPDWEEIRVDAMAYTLAMKLQQHPTAFGEELLSTKKLPIVEMSNRDSFWGAKPDRGETTLIGTNILGQLLTSLRDELRRQKGYIGKTVTRYLTGVKTSTLVINGKPVN